MSGDKSPLAFQTEYIRLEVAQSGRVTSLYDRIADRELIAPYEASPLLSLVVDGETCVPTQVEHDSDEGLMTLEYAPIAVTAVVQVCVKPTHFTFVLQSCEGAKPSHVFWGPFPTTVSRTVGEIVGVAQDGQFAVGIQTLNLHTTGGHPKECVDLGIGTDTHAAAATDSGCAFQAYSRERDGGVIGSSIALFACPAEEALEVIGQIEVAEGLPHPMLDGEWCKTSLTARRSYLITNFSEQNLDEALTYAQTAGFRYIYHEGPFENWGHFRLSSGAFPDGDESLKRCVDRAADVGIRVGVHTLSNFTTTNDPYVTPVPDPRLMRSGTSVLLEPVDATNTEMVVEDVAPFQDRGTLSTVMIGNELIQYQSVSATEPWRLLGCQRGAFGTTASPHSQGAEVGKLSDHPYRIFFPNLEMQDEMADRLVDLFNRTGLRQISFDGLEGCEQTGHGVYSRNRFVKRCFDGWEQEVVNDASGLHHYLWHIHTRMNWGEPWGKAMREGMTEYRFRNQDYFRRNLFPRMLGWFQLRLASSDVEATHRDDIEWTLSKCAGFDAGFALASPLMALQNNGQTADVLNAVREWEAARLANAFTEEQRERMREPNSEFHLEPCAEGGWDLYPVAYSDTFTHTGEERQPGEPEGDSWELENSFSEQPLRFVLRTLPGIGEQQNVALRNPVFEVGVQCLKIPVDLSPRQYLVCDGSDRAQVLDVNWNVIRSVELDTAVPTLATGSQQIRFWCEGGADSPAEIRIKLLGPPERVAGERIAADVVRTPVMMAPASQSRVHRLTPQTYYYTFGPNEPALTIRPGDVVVAKTRDARGYDQDMELLPEELKQRSDVTQYRESNPLVGPIYVEGAEPGDILAVQIKRIQLNRDYAWSRHIAHFGSLTGETPGRELLLNEPIPEDLFDWQLDLERNVANLELKRSQLGSVEIPLHPFLGSIGVAPRFGRIEMSLTPGEYGGNMDCVETKQGTTLYLPVWVRGGYLAFGDVHAAQGDGEICGVALETTAEVELQVYVLKDVSADWPRMEDAEHIMTAGSGRPLMECVRVAQVELVKWLVNGYGFDRWEAWQLNSQVGTMRIGNIVDPSYTVVAKFPKRYLP